MSERVFYDTVIFLLSLNTGDRDHRGCRDLLDIDGTGIWWGIAMSEISRGEAAIAEYLDQIEQRCAVQGIEWYEVRQEEIGSALKKHLTLKSRLSQSGMQTRDIKQVFAAWSARSRLLVTRDRDFFDPKDKRQRSKKQHGNSVSRLLKAELGLEVHLPATALEKLMAQRAT